VILANPDYQPIYNLRIDVLKEMTRALVGDGLILFEPLSEKDIEVACALGHRILQKVPFRNSREEIIYDCLFKKVG
jgi:hypothetical protein